MAEQQGMNRDRLDFFVRTLRSEIEAGRGNGVSTLVARGGQIVLQEAIGSTDQTGAHPVQHDSIFNILSLTKCFTNILAMRQIERGELLFSTTVAEVIPAFAGRGRDGINVLHLLTHSSGLPPIIAPLVGPEAAVLERVIDAICRTVTPVAPPGSIVSYAPAVAHALLAEMIRRRDPRGRTFRQILQDELLDPLGMDDTALGLPAERRSRHVPLRFLKENSGIGGQSNVLVPQMYEDGSEMPWVGATSTVPDLYRLTEMLRGRGRLGDTRVLSSAMVALAAQNHSGERPNNLYSFFSHAEGWGDLPAYIGLGFFLRGTTIAPNRFGSLASPGTFGHTGAGSALFWIDPERDLTFICLFAGLLDEPQNFARYSRLSDIVSAAVE